MIDESNPSDSNNYAQGLKTGIDAGYLKCSECKATFINHIMARQYQSMAKLPGAEPPEALCGGCSWVSDITKVFTVREGQVVVLIAQGVETKDIAEKLGISEGTVHTHRLNATRKLHRWGVTNNVLLARYALRKGWVTL